MDIDHIKKKILSLITFLESTYDISYRDIIRGWSNSDDYDALVSDDLITAIESGGCTYMGIGTTRLCVGVGKYVVKIEYRKNDDECNNTKEVSYYKTLTKKSNIYKAVLLPCVGSFRFRKQVMTIYPKLTICTDYTYDEYIKSKTYIGRKLQFMSFLFEDCYHDNVGLYNGDVFLCDYNVEIGGTYVADLRSNWKRYMGRKHTSLLKKSLQTVGKMTA